jgi:Na+-transporting methylmalonyl-CoA/oxaloacetate decarboxylase gamma subunit
LLLLLLLLLLMLLLLMLLLMWSLLALVRSTCPSLHQQLHNRQVVGPCRQEQGRAVLGVAVGHEGSGL